MDEKMRAEFELELARHFWLKEEDHTFSSDEGEYVSELVQTAWEFWQASRAALVVELPALPPQGAAPYAARKAASDMHAKFRLAISSAGVRVK